VDLPFAFTASSLNSSGKYAPSAQSCARSEKWGLPGTPDCPGAFVTADWSQSARSKMTRSDGPLALDTASTVS
jgi:hypothetical protein